MPKPLRSSNSEQSKMTRIAIVSADRCKPKNCGQVCRKSCPVVRMGKQCIEVTATSKIAFISETLCIGCGICVKKCPYGAISIINLPSNLDKDTTHRYGFNSFKLHRLPTPRPGEILGLVGTNGIGKSTALKILSGKLKPNLGNFKNPPEWHEILAYFRGSELQNYFTKLLEDNLRAVIKPQYVDQIPQAAKGVVRDMFLKKDDLGRMEEMADMLDLNKLMDRNISDLSGGELQRFAIAIVCIQRADIYMFDEPSSYLDVKQRLKAAVTIRSMVNSTNFSIVVEHDLSVLDYLSDFICVLYGVPGAYGVVTMPFSVREGINIFLDGFVPTENLRFRESSLSFKVSDQSLDEQIKRVSRYHYPSMKKKLGNFELTVEDGEFTDSEIIVLLGENGTGKTTMIKLLAGKLQPDEESGEIPQLSISYKPQKISPKSQCKVSELLRAKIPDAFIHPQFSADVLKPLDLDNLKDQEVQNLSGGELQRVALALCLGKPADVYLIDEPSAYLDSEQRLHAAKVIKRFILHAKKTAFVVEHDFIMATYLADRVVVFSGNPSSEAVAASPQSLLNGMNKFLGLLDITFRRDPNNFRPRINKLNSVKVTRLLYFFAANCFYYYCFIFSAGYGAEKVRKLFLSRRLIIVWIGTLTSCYKAILAPLRMAARSVVTSISRGLCTSGHTSIGEVVMSGIQPSGRMHIGNYFGAASQWLRLQSDPSCRRLYLCIADLHALSSSCDPEQLRRDVITMTASLMACGLGPPKCVIFQQSSVSCHGNMYWLLGTFVTLPQLQHLTHYREKATKYKDGNVPLGLFTYPVLQAADILLYRPDVVPVGEDQTQHLRLTQKLARSLNVRYKSALFPIPRQMMAQWPRIKSLRNPAKKMSKSDDDVKGCVYVDDPPEVILERVKKAITDFVSAVTYEPEERPGVANLIRIYCAATGQSESQVVDYFVGKTTAEFKLELADVLAHTFRPVREQVKRLLSNQDVILKTLANGAKEAEVVAMETLESLKRAVGLQVK
ncbi:ABC tran and RLI and Fer4 and tRNA-synt 1b domain containing protein [Trichuris trichiura]|uniref:tryptophan--tRNA ligase n=1 Tax=Trichuris trichiura TaxID=36087 RepID=A0A077Z8D0_TRITR|nr:ABC tran and RLI and Fer4 and tRNA-synt 1b domain containing protein [Trichuris trichiura]